jgi:hypothetical protein
MVVRRFEQVRKPIERYFPPNFHYALSLSTIDDESKPFREAVDSTVGNSRRRPWSNKWDHCIRMRHGIWSGYLMEGNPLVPIGCSRKS